MNKFILYIKKFPIVLIFISLNKKLSILHKFFNDKNISFFNYWNYIFGNNELLIKNICEDA